METISVIIPCFNCCQTIERALLSIINQSRKPNEIIVIDDASNKIELIESILKNLEHECLEKKIDLIFVKLKKNSGPGVARNHGITISKGEYIFFLDSDDCWFQDKISDQIALSKKYKDINVFCHLLDGIPTSGFQFKNSKILFLTFNKLIFSNKVITSSVMIREGKDFLFPSNQRYAEDHSLWLEICFSGQKILLDNNIYGRTFRKDWCTDSHSSSLLKSETFELKNLMSYLGKNNTNNTLMIISIIFSLVKFIRRCIYKIFCVFR